MTSGLTSKKAAARRSNPPRHRRGAGGFTLLEMITVMAIMTLLVGVTSFAYQKLENDESTLKPRNELVRLAKLGVRAATLQGRGFAIAFEKDRFALIGLGEAPDTTCTLPADVTLYLRRWGQTSWEPAAGQRWEIGAQGLCEPIRVRLEGPDSLLELRFNPLTGAPVSDAAALTP
ncbi:MAG: prepilin-type N-terminal cleavage/methylation domain-containing protein [Verrucomicrobiales bacterium]|nr:prepilin-type N-terminal cleavage/methylation domain-containing protein [Verrucomicrobiales bacterium]